MSIIEAYVEVSMDHTLQGMLQDLESIISIGGMLETCLSV